MSNQMDRLMFVAMIGREPQQDDLERANCQHEGEIGHGSCGWCHVHNNPRYQCMCLSEHDWRKKLRTA